MSCQNVNIACHIMPYPSIPYMWTLWFNSLPDTSTSGQMHCKCVLKKLPILRKNKMQKENASFKIALDKSFGS